MITGDQEKPLDDNVAEAQPTKPDESEDFRPEGAEWEPAGGVIQKPPVPGDPTDKPTEGDQR